MPKTIDCPECDGIGHIYYERFVPQSASNPFGEYADCRAGDCANCAGNGTIFAMEDDLEDCE